VPVDGARDANRALFALEAPRQRGSLKPLSPGRYKVEFTAGQALHDKLAQLRDLLRHQVPDGELAVLFERAVDSLIEDTLKQRFAQTRAAKKPRSAKRVAAACDSNRGKAVATEAASLESPTGAPRRTRGANSRYIPRAVVREVYRRDAGQCTFVSSEGKRCSERSFLELHHHDPYARGGQPTVENLRLVCRAHNSFFAERDYGRAFMRSKQKQTREPRDELGPNTVVRSLLPTREPTRATIDLETMQRIP
jgi:5-methylcytosine-specific restriction endonuclease McrA